MKAMCKQAQKRRKEINDEIKLWHEKEKLDAMSEDERKKYYENIQRKAMNVIKTLGVVNTLKSNFGLKY